MNRSTHEQPERSVDSLGLLALVVRRAAGVVDADASRRQGSPNADLVLSGAVVLVWRFHEEHILVVNTDGNSALNEPPEVAEFQVFRVQIDFQGHAYVDAHRSVIGT